MCNDFSSDPVVVLLSFFVIYGGEVPFHWTVFDYVCVDWDGFYDHIIDIHGEMTIYLMWIPLLALLMSFGISSVCN